MTMPETLLHSGYGMFSTMKLSRCIRNCGQGAPRQFRFSSCRVSVEEHFRSSCYSSHWTRSPASCFFIKRPRLLGLRWPAQLHRRANSLAGPILI